MSPATPASRRAPVTVAAMAFSILLVSSLSVGGPASAFSGVDVEIDEVSEPSDRREDARQVESDVPVQSTAVGEVSGRLLLETNGSPIVVTDGLVQFYHPSIPYLLIDEVESEADGTFSITGLPTGSYKVAFSSYMFDNELPVRNWSGGDTNWYDAGLVVFTDGDPYPFGDVVIPRRDTTVDRLAGSNRFGTAAEVGQWYWGSGIGGTVYVVNGFDFPDALSAGAATTNGTLVMVERNSLPPESASELARIQPDRIVVVGGTGVVSSSVFSQLRDYVDSPSDVVRIAGANRYETSRAVITSPDGFNNSVSELIIATGRNFPDALAAVPGAIVSNAAVLLVDGSASRLDTATRNLVQSLGVPVTIVGGTSAVSSGIQSQLTGITQTIRVAGSDRFDTSVKVAQEFFPQADWAFLANGFGFADALAAGPAAGQVNSPVYLTRKECVPDEVFVDILYVLANEVISVGGTGVISRNAANGTPCSA